MGEQFFKNQTGDGNLIYLEPYLMICPQCQVSFPNFVVATCCASLCHMNSVSEKRYPSESSDCEHLHRPKNQTTRIVVTQFGVCQAEPIRYNCQQPTHFSSQRYVCGIDYCENKHDDFTLSSRVGGFFGGRFGLHNAQGLDGRKNGVTPCHGKLGTSLCLQKEEAGNRP